MVSLAIVTDVLSSIRSGPRLLEAIGSTPHAELPRFSRGAARIFAKLEFLNPGGSVKDRIAHAMIEDAEARGLLRPGGTIVEPTSGNTGVALAMIAAAKGYRCIVVMPEGYGRMKAKLMEALGARGRPHAGRRELMTGAIARAEEIARRHRRVSPQPVLEPVNPKTHYETTGPRDLGRARRVDRRLGRGRRNDGHVHRRRAASSPSGSRGSCASPSEPQGSILGGGPHGPHEVEGIGLSF